MNDGEDLIVELYDLFRQRCAEVNRYIEFVEFLVDSRASGFSREVDGQLLPLPGYGISRELSKTLRANSYLLLYNLVEATMTNAVDAIHKAVEIDNLGFDQLSRELQNVALRHFKKAIRDDHRAALDEREHPIQFAMARLGYNREDIFSGNVDCGEIKITAKRYGFKSPDPNKNGRGILGKMRDIKDKRNALAHGRLSFEQCGQDTSPEYLSVVARQTMVYLRTVLWSVSHYLRSRSYAALVS